MSIIESNIKIIAGVMSTAIEQSGMTRDEANTGSFIAFGFGERGCFLQYDSVVYNVVMGGLDGPFSSGWGKPSFIRTENHGTGSSIPGGEIDKKLIAIWKKAIDGYLCEIINMKNEKYLPQVLQHRVIDLLKKQLKGSKA
jgi:hypothetical protein